MTPRPYTMRKRAAAQEETRRRILEATFALHSEKGVAGTSWQDIAAAAGVSVGTVYYHFPTVDELVPACTGLGLQLAPVPTPEIFRGIRGRKRRIECLVRALFAVYEKVGAPMRFTLIERRSIPAVGRFADEMFAQVRALVREALGPEADERTVDAVDALVDFRVWDSLSERGLDGEVIVETVTESIHRIARHR